MPYYSISIITYFCKLNLKWPDDSTTMHDTLDLKSYIKNL